jgi:photosynthetic reaction center H subunit
MMQTGALTQYLDVAQVVLYAFWVFFVGLIFYIRQEDRREGYPLEHDKTGKVGPKGFPFMADPKTFALPHGLGNVSFPNDVRDSARDLKLQRTGPWPGSAYEPVGNPMLAQVGPGSYAERADRPDLTHTGEPKIVPLGKTHGYTIHGSDPDPRGMPVMGCDGKKAGTVVDVWCDQSEHMIRYYEVDIGTRKALIPWTFVVFKNNPQRLYINALTSTQFANIPATKAADSVTLLEEDKIMGYFGGGMLYATPIRSEPIL